MTASVVQAISILSLALVLVAVSGTSSYPTVVGFVELLSTCIIVLSALALVSNGVTYGKIRERIMDAANRASRSPSIPPRPSR